MHILIPDGPEMVQIIKRSSLGGRVLSFCSSSKVSGSSKQEELDSNKQEELATQGNAKGHHSNRRCR